MFKSLMRLMPVGGAWTGGAAAASESSPDPASFRRFFDGPASVLGFAGRFFFGFIAAASTAAVAGSSDALGANLSVSFF